MLCDRACLAKLLTYATRCDPALLEPLALFWSDGQGSTAAGADSAKQVALSLTCAVLRGAAPAPPRAPAPAPADASADADAEAGEAPSDRLATATATATELSAAAAAVPLASPPSSGGASSSADLALAADLALSAAASGGGEEGAPAACVALPPQPLPATMLAPLLRLSARLLLCLHGLGGAHEGTTLLHGDSGHYAMVTDAWCAHADHPQHLPHTAITTPRTIHLSPNPAPLVRSPTRLTSHTPCAPLPLRPPCLPPLRQAGRGRHDGAPRACDEPAGRAVP